MVPLWPHNLRSEVLSVQSEDFEEGGTSFRHVQPYGLRFPACARAQVTHQDESWNLQNPAESVRHDFLSRTCKSDVHSTLPEFDRKEGRTCLRYAYSPPCRLGLCVPLCSRVAGAGGTPNHDLYSSNNSDICSLDGTSNERREVCSSTCSVGKSQTVAVVSLWREWWKESYRAVD